MTCRCSLYYHDYYVKIFQCVKKTNGYGELRNKDAHLLNIMRGVNNTPVRVSWRYMFSINWRDTENFLY